MRPGGIRGWGVLAVLMAAGLAPAMAVALKNRSASAPLNGYGGTATPTASCQPGERLVSGGFDHPDRSLNAYVGPAGYFWSSHRSGRRSWSAGAENLGVGNGTAVAYAYCTRGRGVRTRAASGPIPGGGSALGSVTARCKPGEKAISGGFDNPDQQGEPWSIIASHRTGRRSWTASARSGSLAEGRLDVFAYCRARGRVRTRSDSATVPHNVTATGTATAECKPGEKLLSGGFSNPDPDPDGAFAYFSSHRLGKRGWTVSAVNTDSADRTLVAFAYCRPG